MDAFTSDCPHDVFQRGLVLYRNSFSGFESPNNTKKKRFVLCLIEELEPDVIEKIKSATHCLSLKQSYFIDTDYLSVHWTEYDKRFIVLTVLLQMGYSFQAQTKTQPFFSPKDGDREFTPESLEKKSIAQCRQFLFLKESDRRKPALENFIDDSFCEEWNYITPEGKAFAKELREGVKKWKYDSKRENFYKDPLFQSYDPNTLLSLPINTERPKKKQKTTVVIIESSEDEEKTEDIPSCVICYEKEANTMVLPCEHNVVCKECALKLEGTKNSNICVLCQQQIEHKLY